MILNLIDEQVVFNAANKWLVGFKIISFLICTSVLVYICWHSHEDFIFIGVGIFMMVLSCSLPFRRFDLPQELCWDLFALLMSLAVFINLYEMFIETATIDYLLSYSSIRRFHQQVLTWPLWITISCSYIVSDFLGYWCHRLLHGRYLWSSHANHHSAQHLNWLSGMRTSMMHIAILLLPYTLTWVFLPLPQVGMIAMTLLLIDAFNQHYLHTNLRFPWQKQLEWLLVTPRFHFVHHSNDRRFSDSNYGFIFSIWDRIFGTFTDPESIDANQALGLNYEISKWRLLLGIPPAKSFK